MPNYVNSKLKGITKFGDSTLNDHLESSLCSFFDWGTLEAEAFFSVTKPSLGPYGGDYTTLNPIHDPNYTDGKVWETQRPNWVWETGLNYSSYQPINISGIYVNNSFIPATSTGTYAHTINYLDGQVIFSNAVPTSSQVYCNHSFKYFNWTTSEAPWFREVIFDSFRPDDVESSGRMKILQKNRVNLPAVVVEVSPSRTQDEGLELGGGQWVCQDVKFHIYSENSWDRKKLVDMITFQNHRNIIGYDKNIMRDSGYYPVSYPGTVTGTVTTYPNWIENAFWRKIFIKKVRWENGFQQPPYFFYDVVRATCEIDMPEI